MNTNCAGWYRIANVAEVASPALLVYPERIEANVRKMITLAGSPDRLCPHIKTHKLPQIVRLQQALGVEKFKCATIAEAEMLAGCGVRQILLAYELVGPNVQRFVELARSFPEVRFAALVDCTESLRDLAQAAHRSRVEIETLLDIDCGLGRTGVPADSGNAVEIYRLAATLPGVRPGGLHVYDGHIIHRDPAQRANAAEAVISPVMALRDKLLDLGLQVPRIVAGGSPTFPSHARNRMLECSPGTTLLWDSGYAECFPDLDFVPAAAVLSRVISRPGPNRLCLDLGCKAVASDTDPRVWLPDLPNATVILHHEEHLVIESSQADKFAIGEAVYGIPWHICPTVALYECVNVVRRGRAEGNWKVIGRDRTLTV